MEKGFVRVRDGPPIEVWRTKSPEAETFSLNYTLILDFLDAV